MGCADRGGEFHQDPVPAVDCGGGVDDVLFAEGIGDDLEGVLFIALIIGPLFQLEGVFFVRRCVVACDEAKAGDEGKEDREFFHDISMCSCGFVSKLL